MIIHDLKLIFVHNPRTGGGSIQQALINASQDDFEMCESHASLEHIKKNCEKDLSDYKSAAFVRCPWSRAVSDYISKAPGITFKEYLTDPVRPQVEYVDSSIDFVGRYEELQSGFDHICEQMLGMDGSPLTLTNRSDYQFKTWKEWYDLDDVETVRDFYSEDIERFEFEFQPYGPDDHSFIVHC